MHFREEWATDGIRNSQQAAPIAQSALRWKRCDGRSPAIADGGIGESSANGLFGLHARDKRVQRRSGNAWLRLHLAGRGDRPNEPSKPLSRMDSRLDFVWLK